MSLAELILSADDLPREPLPTPEWPAADGKLFIRALTGQERRDLELLFRQNADAEESPNNQEKLDPRAFVAAKAFCDENGQRVFQDNQIKALAGKNSIPLDRAYDKCVRLSGIRLTAEEAEQEKKTSEKTTSSGSSSG